MTDRITPEHRSWNMSRIRGKDTSIEVAVRKSLFSKGYRFRKNDKRLPGKPDIVLSKYKSVIFIHGCFWHRHPGCRLAAEPKTRIDFWNEKFYRNVENDKKYKARIEAMGWKVIVVWECEIKNRFQETMEQIEVDLASNILRNQVQS